MTIATWPQARITSVSQHPSEAGLLCVDINLGDGAAVLMDRHGVTTEVLTGVEVTRTISLEGLPPTTHWTLCKLATSGDFVTVVREWGHSAACGWCERVNLTQIGGQDLTITTAPRLFAGIYHEHLTDPRLSWDH